MEREKTGATINSTLVMRGERKGHRDAERMERQREDGETARGKKQIQRMRQRLHQRYRSQPKNDSFIHYSNN